jgi:hypothetical protein
MPLQKLALRPGVNRESTSYANEGGYYSSNKIRFRSGQPEKVGGWTKDTGTNVSTLQPTTGTLWGVCRALWNWINLSGANLLSLGTNLKYYIQSGISGNFYDVTPLRNPLGTSPGEVTFAATNGSPIITVTDAGHGAQAGDFVTYSGAVSLGGNITATALNAEFQIASYVNSNQYTIVASVQANGSDSGNGGGSVVGTYQITSGSDIYTQNVGWGAGTWGGIVTGAVTTTLATALPSTTLTAALSASATTITVASTTGFAASGSLWIGNELITYTGGGGGGTSLTGCTRATSGTTAFAYPNGMPVAANITSVVLTSASGFASTGTNYVLIDNEIISYTGVSTNTLTGCTRGASGSHAAGHAALVTVVQSYNSTSTTYNYTGWGSSAPASQGIGQQLRLWSQSNFGEDLIFNPRGGALYYWANSASLNVYNRGQLLGPSSSVVTKLGTISVDAYCPSVANIVMVSDASRFVLAFGCNDSVVGSSIQDPLLIYWSDQESFATWYPQATNQAGSYRLSHGSQIVTAIQTRQEILVLTDASIYSMQYLGPPYVWGFQIMGDNISIAGPNAIATANNIAYWMGTDKFYMYSGRVQTLPSTLREYVYTDINLTQSYQFMAGTNEGYNEVWWQYCSISGPNGTGTTSNPNTVVDRYVIYNHLDDVWYYGDWSNYTGIAYQGRTAWLDSSLRPYPMAATYAVAGGSANTIVVYHESGTNDGTVNPAVPIVSQVTSSDFDIGDGHNFGFVWRLIPDLTFDGSNNVNNPQAMFTVLPRANPGANYGPSNDPAVVSAQNYTNTKTYAVQQFTQQVYVRIRGRQMAFKVSSGTVGSNTEGLGVQWQLGVPRIDIRPDGRR